MGKITITTSTTFILLSILLSICEGAKEWKQPEDGNAILVTSNDRLQTIVFESPTEGRWEIGNGEIWHLPNGGTAKNVTAEFEPIPTEYIEKLRKELSGGSIRNQGDASASIRPFARNKPSGSNRSAVAGSGSIRTQQPSSGSIRGGSVKNVGSIRPTTSSGGAKPGSIRNVPNLPSESIRITSPEKTGSIRVSTGGSIRQPHTVAEIPRVSGSIRSGVGGIQLSDSANENIIEKPSGSIRQISEDVNIRETAAGSIRPSVTGSTSTGVSSTSTRRKAMESSKVIYIKKRDQHFLQRQYMISKDGKQSASVYDVFDNQKKQCGRVLFVDKELDIEHMDSYILLNSEPTSSSSLKFETVQQCADMSPFHLKIPLLYIIAMTSIPYILDKEFDQKKNEILSIGLGGGSIDMFFHTKQPESKIDVVELSPLVLEAATTWFGVINSDMHKLHNDDGIKFIKNAQANGVNYDAIFIDACDKEMCPAKGFLDVLSIIKKILKKDGVVIFNVIALEVRNKEMMVQTVLKKIKDNFKSCIQITVSENTVISCTMLKKNTLPEIKQIEKTIKNQLVRHGDMTLNEMKIVHSNFSGIFNIKV